MLPGNILDLNISSVIKVWSQFEKAVDTCTKTWRFFINLLKSITFFVPIILVLTATLNYVRKIFQNKIINK